MFFTKYHKLTESQDEKGHLAKLQSILALSEAEFADH